MVAAQPPAVVHLSAPPPAVHARTNPAPHGWAVHVVRPGETISHLAVAYRTTMHTLIAKNHLSHAGRLVHPGQRVLVPRQSAPARPATTGAAAPRATAAVRYTVRAGDTLSQIAAARHTTVARLLKANGLSAGSLIHPGQRLVVAASPRPAATTPRKSTAPRSTRTYVVRSGDTLDAIAARHGTTVAALSRTNRLQGTSLRVGQHLAVPAPPRATAPSRAEVKALIVATAHRHGVDPKLALAIGWQESGWNQSAVSSANARGVMQVIPDAGDWASQLVGRKLDLSRTEDNVTAGVVILRALGRMADSRTQVIASYYQGLGSVRSRGMYDDTVQYVANVNALRKRM